MRKDETKVLCESPTPGKKPTRIDKWKYDRVRSAILRTLSANRRGVAFQDLPEQVKMRMRPVDLDRLGSVSWYTTTVKLDLEVRGEIERLPGTSPQMLRKVGRRPW